MLIARNPLDNTYISAFDFKRTPPQARPNDLLCPGLSPDGSPCSASVRPAALESGHKHPHFRVRRVNDHVDDCTESSTRVNPADKNVDRRGVKGKEAPRGPKDVFRSNSVIRKLLLHGLCAARPQRSRGVSATTAHPRRGTTHAL